MIGSERSSNDEQRLKAIELSRLPPSAKFVLKVLREKKYATFQEIVEETGLPERTVKHALKKLKELRLVKALPCIGDARRKVYVLCYTTS